MNKQAAQGLRCPPPVLTINGGSSSIKCALFEPGEPPRLMRSGQIERIGQATASFSVKGTPARKIAAAACAAEYR